MGTISSKCKDRNLFMKKMTIKLDIENNVNRITLKTAKTENMHCNMYWRLINEWCGSVSLFDTFNFVSAAI